MNIRLEDYVIYNFAIALGVGLIIGAERERNNLNYSRISIGGIRTFTIASLLGAVSAYTNFWLFLTSIIGVISLISFLMLREHKLNSSITTEISLIMTVILGGISINEPRISVIIGLTLTILLSTKDAIHEFVTKKLSNEIFNDFLVLSVSTLIILPLIPNHFTGPFNSINPRNLWLIVIFILIIGMLSQAILKLFGNRIGMPVLGFLTGFISSIATITAMSSYANKSPELLKSAVAGSLFSCVSTIIQLSFILIMINIESFSVLFIPLIAGGASATILGLIHSVENYKESNSYINQFQYKSIGLYSAIFLVIVIATILVTSSALNEWFGVAGVVAISAISGIVDVHSPTIAIVTMADIGELRLDQVSIPILAALTTNSLTKVIAAVMNGPRRFWMPLSIGIFIQISLVWVSWLFLLLKNTRGISI